ncbi:MAG TPA: hypothetical protein VFX02_03745 [Gammaproteobacteria bacterium]|nr:hypothetical protein [Gammaproteobacteria bacterium]
MIKTYKNLLMVLALLPPWAFAQTVGVEVVQVDSPPENTLHSGEPLYVRLKYKSNQPLRFQLVGYSGGANVDKPAALNPAPAYPTGEGEALAWIAYTDKVDIDEFRIQAYDKDWNIVQEISAPMEMHWSGMPVRTWRQPAQWVQELNAQLEALTPTGSMEQPPKAMEQTPAGTAANDSGELGGSDSNTSPKSGYWALPILGLIVAFLVIAWFVKRKVK